MHVVHHKDMQKISIRPFQKSKEREISFPDGKLGCEGTCYTNYGDRIQDAGINDDKDIQ